MAQNYSSSNGKKSSFLKKTAIAGLCIIAVFVMAILTSTKGLSSEKQYDRGKLYLDSENYTETVTWWTKTEKAGDAEAQFINGCHTDEQSLTQDDEEVKKYRQAAEQGDADAQYNLGFCYEHGQGVTKNRSEAMKWYRKAAEQGHAYAQSRLGFCYKYGRGVTQNYTEAVKWWRKAAEQGNSGAQCGLGICYEEGQGVPQDYTEAVKWYRKAAEQGNTYAQEKMNDYKTKQSNTSTAARQSTNNNTTTTVNARSLVETGMRHYNAKNYAEAVKWFRKAAEQGNADAQYNLGACYYNGQGVTKDYTEAVKWIRKAAEQGFAGAQYNLGNCYYKGNGVTQNYTEAVKWYRKAAEQGNAEAQYHLGELLCKWKRYNAKLYGSSEMVSQSRRARRCQCSIQFGLLL